LYQLKALRHGHLLLFLRRHFDQSDDLRAFGFAATISAATLLAVCWVKPGGFEEELGAGR
jgi:hypothetical protein